MGVYSFLDTSVSIVGPGVNVNIEGGTPGSEQIGSSAGAAKEGVTVAFDDPKDTKVVGADGAIMHSLHASQAGKFTVRLLKTSPINAVLSQAYAAQRGSAANWGQNVIVLTNNVLGDVAEGAQMAFEKFPDNEYAEDGNTLTWVFTGLVDELLGPGLAVAA